MKNVWSIFLTKRVICTVLFWMEYVSICFVRRGLFQFLFGRIETLRDTLGRWRTSLELFMRLWGSAVSLGRRRNGEALFGLSFNLYIPYIIKEALSLFWKEWQRFKLPSSDRTDLRSASLEAYLNFIFFDLEFLEPPQGEGEHLKSS